MISAVMIDSREPEWVQRLTFGNVPTAVVLLDYGDLHVACDDGNILVIERKTPDDFLNSLKEDRLFVQAAKCATARIEAQLSADNLSNIWPYLMITGQFYPAENGMTYTPRGITGWKWNSVMGALLSIQEMGVAIAFAANDEDYEHCVIALGNRNRDSETLVLPPKPPSLLGPREQIIASLPGIGLERMKAVIDAAGTAGWAMVALTDQGSSIPGVPNSVKVKVRSAFGLNDNEQFAIMPLGSQ